jgi:PAS domain-containing protein
VLIVDATSLKVVDSNPAAVRAFGDGQAALARRTVLSAVERAPDGLVVTDPGGCVLYANARFAEMAQMDSSKRMVGESFDRWLGRSWVDLGVLIAKLRQNDSA